MEEILGSVASVSKVPLPVWLCLLFLLISLTLGLIWLFRAAFRLWRDLKTLGRWVDGTMAGLSQALERLAERSAAFGAAFPQLAAANARLGISLARLAVLRAAVRDVQDEVGRVAAVYPRK
jgi:hypothetical protein